MDVVVHAHTIPYIGTLPKSKTKAQVRLELDLYINDLMCIATSLDLHITVNIMHKYVVGLTALKTMMHMLSDKLDRGV